MIRSHVWIGVVCLFALAVCFTAYNLRISRAEGRLSTVTNYDDITYLSKAASIYFLGHGQGVGPAIHELFTRNLHAPFTVFSGLLGFVVFGYDLDRVYYALALVVFAYLLGVTFFARHLSFPLRWALIGASLAIPFAAFASVEFRPDQMWAVVLGFAGVAWIGEPGVFSRRRYSVLFGAAIGLALLTKPSVFAMTLLVGGGCWFLAAFRGWLAGQFALRTLLGSFLIAAITAVLVCGWFWLQHAGEVLEYFYVNSFGANRDIWEYQGGLVDRCTYYFRGDALSSNLGLLWIPLSAVYLAGAIWDLVAGQGAADRFRGASFLWMLACLAVVNVLFGIKTPYLGGSFYGFLIFGAFFYAAAMLQRFSVWCAGRRGPEWAVATALVVAAWSLHNFPSASKVYGEAAANQKMVNIAALTTLEQSARGGESVLFTQGNPVVPEFVGMELLARGKPVDCLVKHKTRTLVALQPDIAAADFVFVQDQGIVGAPGDAIPGEKIQPEVKAFLDSSPDWKLAATYGLSRGKNVYLYRREQIPPKRHE